MIEDIKDLLERQPFEPFRIRLSSGDAYQVRNPHAVALLRNRLFIVVPNGQNDRWTFLSYLHIAAVETIGNGTRPSRRRRR